MRLFELELNLHGVSDGDLSSVVHDVLVVQQLRVRDARLGPFAVRHQHASLGAAHLGLGRAHAAHTLGGFSKQMCECVSV